MTGAGCLATAGMVCSSALKAGANLVDAISLSKSKGGGKAEHARALTSIPQVPLPATDPVFGPQGPLVALWRP